MAGSRVAVVRGAITDGLATFFAGLADFNGTTRPEWKVEVSYAYKFGSHAAERVFFGRATGETPPAAMRAGRNFRDETGRGDLVVLVSRIGGDGRDADTRAIAIGEQVETWIADRKNNELNVTGLQNLVIDGWELVNLANDKGHMTEITYKVRWTARLT